jgi:hypothetical protein
MDIMQDSQEFFVDFYLSEKIRNQVNEGENIFLSDSSMILDQLKNKAYDLVIIGTLHRYFNTFQVITQKYNTAVIVHNLNFTHTSGLRLVKNIFKADIIYRLKLWWKEGLFNASKIYQETKNVLVLDEALSSERFKFLPIFYTQNFERSENQNFVVVIPGGVSQKRRDYNHIFNMIQNLKTDEKYEFIFLGRAKDHELKKLEKLAIQLPSNVDVRYFSERVSQKDFDFWMHKANVLWCPIQPETEFFSQKEIYGNSKMTGNLGDAIKYGKLAVFPENYPCQLDFIIPEQQDILKQFQELKNTDFDFQLKYNKNTVRENLEKVLNSLISI